MKTLETPSVHGITEEKITALYNASGVWPKLYSARFIEPGLARYSDIGTLLIKKDALDNMAKSYVGKPVVNVSHRDIALNDLRSQSDGYVTDVWYEPTDGWYYCSFLVLDEATQRNCESKAYSVSCAYVPNSVSQDSGTWHNIPYDGEILNGEYSHLAIVDNPRYEGAHIICNSKGDNTMNLKFWKKDKKDVTNSTGINLDTAMVEIDGQKIAVKDLVDTHKAEQLASKPAESQMLPEDTVLEIDGDETPLKSLIDSHRTATARKATEAEMANKALTNAADEVKKKEDEAKALELKNAAEAKAKEDEAKKALENEAELKKAEELKNAKHFHDLKNAVTIGGEPQTPKIVLLKDKWDEGKRMYGSGK